MSEDVANALLDILNRYDIGEPWRSMEDKKPDTGKYFFIKMKKSAGYTDPYWDQPLLTVRVKGGFHIAGSPFKDEEVEAYSEVRIPKQGNGRAKNSWQHSHHTPAMPGYFCAHKCPAVAIL